MIFVAVMATFDVSTNVEHTGTQWTSQRLFAYRRNDGSACHLPHIPGADFRRWASLASDSKRENPRCFYAGNSSKPSFCAAERTRSSKLMSARPATAERAVRAEAR